MILCNQKDFNGAIEQATEVLNDFENDVKALYRRATAHFKSGDFAAAKADLKLAYKQDKSNKGVAKMMKKVVKAQKKARQSQSNAMKSI